jgi:hypothetical protein
MLALQGDGKTGVLEVHAGSARTAIHYVGGKLAWVEGGPRMPLDRRLVRHGLLTEEQHRNVLARMVPSALKASRVSDAHYAEVVVALGYLTERQVQEALTEQMRAKVIGCMGAHRAEWIFLPQEREVEHNGFPIRVEPLILATARTFDGFRLESVLARGTERMPVLIGEPLSVAAAFEMSELEADFLYQIDGSRSMDALLSAKGFNVRALLAALIMADTVIVGRSVPVIEAARTVPPPRLSTAASEGATTARANETETPTLPCPPGLPLQVPPPPPRMVTAKPRVRDDEPTSSDAVHVLAVASTGARAADRSPGRDEISISMRQGAALPAVPEMAVPSLASETGTVPDDSLARTRRYQRFRQAAVAWALLAAAWCVWRTQTRGSLPPATSAEPPSSAALSPTATTQLEQASSASPLAAVPLSTAWTEAKPHIAEARPPSLGELRTARGTGGHRVWVDGKLVGEAPLTFPLACGRHWVRVGSAGRSEGVDVPCEGTVTVPVHR